MWVGGLLQVWQAGLRQHEGPAGVDVLHQVVALDGDRLDGREVDRAGVVDADVDASELVDHLLDRGLHALVVADIACDRQRFAAGRADLLGGRVDRALEIGMRLLGLGDDGDLGSVVRRAERDRQADAAAAARHHKYLPRKRSLEHG